MIYRPTRFRLDAARCAGQQRIACTGAAPSLGTVPTSRARRVGLHFQHARPPATSPFLTGPYSGRPAGSACLLAGGAQ